MGWDEKKKKRKEKNPIRGIRIGKVFKKKGGGGKIETNYSDAYLIKKKSSSVDFNSNRVICIYLFIFVVIIIDTF